MYNKPRTIYFYLKTGNIKDFIAFFSTYRDYETIKISERYVKIDIYDNFDINEIKTARELMIEEVFVDFVAFIEPLNFELDTDKVLQYLPLINPNIYTLESLITEAFVMNNAELKKLLKNSFYNQVNQETISTVIGFIEANLNASTASKRLFMHRNTLNYRLDNFIEKTEINIKNFKGAMAIYLLFRR